LAFADARNAFPVGAGRPSAEGLWRPNSFGAQADRWPEAFALIEIGLLERLRAGRWPSPTQGMPFRSAQADRWPKALQGRIHSTRKADRWLEAFAPIEIGLPRRLRAGRRPSPTRRVFFGRRRPTVGRRPSRSNSFDA